MRLTEGLKKRFAAKGAEEVNGKNVWLDNDDIRPLAIKDRTWSQKTYFTFWFSAVATGRRRHLSIKGTLDD
jgi:cytosine/uracil/thiamine/allantoin permease